MGSVTVGNSDVTSEQASEFRRVFGLSTPGYALPAGSSAAQIQAALDYLATLEADAVLVVDGGCVYQIDQPIIVDASRVSINWNGATLDCSQLPAGQIAFSILSTDVTPERRYPRNNYMSNFLIVGNVDQGRDFDATALYLSADVESASVRFKLEHFSATAFKYGVRIKNRAYFTALESFQIYRCGFCLQQDSGASDFAECVSISDGRLFNSDCLVRDLGGQRLKFSMCSFDFHGDATGTRIRADDRIFDLRNGSQVELYGCHIEWAYGDVAGQTNAPIKLQGANTRFVMFGGKIYKGHGQNPYYGSVFESDNASQWIVLDSVHMVKLGRIGNSTHNDCLVNGSNANNAGTVGRVVIRNAMPDVVTKDDLPSTISYTYGASLLRQGVEDPFAELGPRISVTGSATAVSVNSPDGGISARSNVSNKMIKIQGQGTVLISFPIVEPLIRHAWSMFLEASLAVGSFTVRERHSTAVTKWNGSTLVTAADTRNSYSGVTHSVTGGSAGWNRVSWKDTASITVQSPRMNNDVFAIEINTASLTSGAIYISDFGYGLM